MVSYICSDPEDYICVYEAMSDVFATFSLLSLDEEAFCLMK